MPAFRALLHRSQHSFHSRRGGLRHWRLRRQGGVRRRVDGRHRRPRAHRQHGGRRPYQRRRRPARLVPIRRGSGVRGCCPAGVGRIRDALLVGHHGTAQGRPQAATGRRQRLLGPVRSGDGVDAPLRHEPVECVPVTRTALSRGRGELHHGRQPRRPRRS